MELILKREASKFELDLKTLIFSLDSFGTLDQIDKNIQHLFDSNIENSNLFIENYFATFKNNYHVGPFVFGMEETIEERKMEMENQYYRRNLFLKLFLEIFPFINFVGVKKSNIRLNKPSIKKDSYFILKKLFEINSIEFLPLEWLFLAEGVNMREKDKTDIFNFLLNNELIEFDLNNDIRISWKGKVYLEEFKF